MQQKSQHCCSDSFSPLVLFFFFSLSFYFPVFFLAHIIFPSFSRLSQFLFSLTKKYFFKHTPLEKTPLCFHFLLLGQNVGDFNEPHRSRYHWRTHRSHAFQVLSYFYEDTSRWEECQLLKGYTKLSESKSWTWIHEFFWNSNSFYSHTSYASQQSSVCIAVLATVFYITTVLVRYPKAGYFYTERETLCL